MFGLKFWLKKPIKPIVYVFSNTTNTHNTYDTYNIYNYIVRFISTYDTYQWYSTFFTRYDTYRTIHIPLCFSRSACWSSYSLTSSRLLLHFSVRRALPCSSRALGLWWRRSSPGLPLITWSSCIPKTRPWM